MPTYAQAGVDIAEGDRLVSSIKKSVRSTFSKSVLSDIGSFGAFFDARFKGYKSPVLVSSVDGVGTKLKVAQMMGRHDTVGRDLVNHCVNDIVVCGARPLFFLDYFATGRMDAAVASKVISGFVAACRENACSLIGGETAEMPGMYDAGEYDLAGTIVGVVERKRIIDGRGVKEGDVLVGLASTGLHTNGYSLARAILLTRHGLEEYIEELGGTLGDVLLAVHRSYAKIVRRVTEKFTVRGLAHITGGGIAGNTLRVVPRGLGLDIDWEAWDRPAIFRMLQREGGVPEDDMRRTFNLGIGLVIIVPPGEQEGLMRFLKKQGEPAWVLGSVVKKKSGRMRGEE